MCEDAAMNEIWKPIQDNPRYEVSNCGYVRSVDRYIERNGSKQLVRGQMLKQTSINGYMRVTIYYGKRNVKRQVFVHRLVAECFIDNPNKYPYINHKDEDKSNNHVNNLEWCTAKYNSNYGTSIERRVKNQNWDSIADKQSKPIVQIDLQGNVIKTYKSMMDAERHGYRSSGISKCCNGYLKTYRGYKWILAT